MLMYSCSVLLLATSPSKCIQLYSCTTVDRVFIGTTSTLLYLIKAVDIK